MKKIYLFIVGACFATISSFFGSTAQAQNGAGNGGDPLRNLYEKAQTTAPQMVAKILPCSFKPEVPVSVSDWIIKNQAAYIQDMRMSQLKWVVDLQGTCAFTALNSAANIYLSYNECRESTHSLEDGIYTILHESVHHFGVPDEGFADAVAHAILYGTNPVDSCPAEGTPFNPNYCQGSTMSDAEALARFQPGATQASLGASYSWMVRSRTCQTLTGCAGWEDVGVLAQDQNYKPITKMSSNLSIKDGKKIVINFYVGNDGLLSLFNFNLDDLSVASYGGPRLTLLMDSSRMGAAFVDFPDKKVTNHCLWFHRKDNINYGNGVTREMELAIFGNH